MAGRNVLKLSEIQLELDGLSIGSGATHPAAATTVAIDVSVCASNFFFMYMQPIEPSNGTQIFSHVALTLFSFSLDDLSIQVKWILLNENFLREQKQTPRRK